MKEKIDVLLSNSAITTRINELGDKINRDYKNKEIQLICILKGSVMFMSDLSKKITVPVYYHFMKVSSYGSGTDSSGVLKVELDLTESIEGKKVATGVMTAEELKKSKEKEETNPFMMRPPGGRRGGPGGPGGGGLGGPPPR